MHLEKLAPCLLLAAAITGRAAAPQQAGPDLNPADAPARLKVTEPAALLEGEWQPVRGDYQSADGLMANTNGEVFFSDRLSTNVWKIGLDGKVTVFKNAPGGALTFGSDGKLYHCQGANKRIVAYDPAGNEETVVTDVEPNDIAAAHNGNLYITDSRNKKVWLINSRREKRVVDEGITFPNGIRFSPDQTRLYVSDYRGDSVYAFEVLPDGSLTNRQPHCRLRLKEGSMQSSADGMTVDVLGWIYVTTDSGLQVCDASGKVQAGIPKPEEKGTPSVTFGGKDLKLLFLSCGGKVYRRLAQSRGALSFERPTLPFDFKTPDVVPRPPDFKTQEVVPQPPKVVPRR